MSSITTTLKEDNVLNAKNAVAVYKNTCEDIFKNLNNDITNLIASGFLGNASDGYKEFYDQIAPAISTNITGDTDSVIYLLNTILDLVQQMLNPVDTKMEETNRNAAGQNVTIETTV